MIWSKATNVRLLVSVTDAEEAARAMDGGADIIDAKDPRAGALGAVALDPLRGIHAAVAAHRPVTAAIGDAIDEHTTERMTRCYAAAGAALVKIGFAGTTHAPRVARLLAAAVRGAGASELPVRSSVVAVAYADADRVDAIDAHRLVEIAANAGASGVLLDTADKSHAGLFELMTARELHHWVADAHASGLFVALAGKLTDDDLARVRDAGADIAGVRGAACIGGRTGRIDTARVRQLRTRIIAPGRVSSVDALSLRLPPLSVTK